MVYGCVSDHLAEIKSYIYLSLGLFLLPRYNLIFTYLMLHYVHLLFTTPAFMPFDSIISCRFVLLFFFSLLKLNAVQNN